MKKLLFAGLVLMSTFAFTACGEKTASEGETTDSTATVTEESTMSTETDTTQTMGTDTTGTGAASTTPAVGDTTK